MASVFSSSSAMPKTRKLPNARLRTLIDPMDDSLYFSEPHLATREMVRQFAQEEVAPVAAKLDADAKFPWDNIRKMSELGLLGVPWSEELGGAGLDLISFMIVIHELAKF